MLDTLSTSSSPLEQGIYYLLWAEEETEDLEVKKKLAKELKAF